jgi:hypothetical protein
VVALQCVLHATCPVIVVRTVPQPVSADRAAWR